VDEDRTIEAHGHHFDVLTSTCDCGMTMSDMTDANPRKPPVTHDDVLNPGTVAAVYHQRSTGRSIPYRKRKK
jgi:hypothetical protein